VLLKISEFFALILRNAFLFFFWPCSILQEYGFQTFRKFHQFIQKLCAREILHNSLLFILVFWLFLMAEHHNLANFQLYTEAMHLRYPE